MRIIACALCALILWTFAPLARAGFVYEDARWDALSDALEDVQPGQLSARWITSRPVMLASWRWQQLRRHSALVFHVVNLSLHCAVSAGVGLVAYRVGMSIGASVIAACVMALHPMSVETASYLSARPELFAALGVLACCWVMGREDFTVWHVFAVQIMVGMALLLKETAIIAPVLILVLRRHFGVAMLSACVLAVILWPYRGFGVWVNYDWTPSMAVAWALQQSAAGVRLLSALILPLPSRLAVDFDYAAVPMFAQIASALTLIGVGVSAWFVRHRMPMVSMACLWALAVIVPRLIVVTTHGPMNEHQFYMGTVGYALCIGDALGGPCRA